MKRANGKPVKPRGRPREFDREAALEQAIDVFWRHGYEATSVSDLTAAMNINPPSLYAAFGDKEKLFLEAVGDRGCGDARLAARRQALLGTRGVEASCPRGGSDAETPARFTRRRLLAVRAPACRPGARRPGRRARLAGPDPGGVERRILSAPADPAAAPGRAARRRAGDGGEQAARHEPQAVSRLIRRDGGGLHRHE